MAGAPPVSWAGLRVVKAAAQLTSGQKLVWLEIWGLANKSPDRAYMSARNIGRRLAMGCDNVEKARRELKRAGLLGSAPRPGRHEASWWPILPARCVPSSERPSDEEVFSLAALLDDQIRRAGSSGEADESTPGAPQESTGAAEVEAYRSTPRAPPANRVRTPIRVIVGPGSSGVPQSASRGSGIGVLQSASEGGKGGASTLSPSTLPEVGTTPPSPPPPSLPPSEAGEKVGPFAHEREEKAQDEVGANSNSQPATNGRPDVLVQPSAAGQPISTRDQLLAARRANDEEFRAEQAQALTAGERR